MIHPLFGMRTGARAALALGASVVLAAGMIGPAAAVPGESGGPSAQAAAAQLAKGSGKKASTDPASYTDGLYIVSMVAPPLAGNDATSAPAGQKLNVHSAAAQAYAGKIKNEQASAMAKVGATALRQFTVTTNGFSAELTAKQAAGLAADPNVFAVTKNSLRQIQTDKSPDFLDMPAVWSQLGGRADAGKGIVVGVLDTGIWPESASFQGAKAAPGSWVGACEAGVNFPVNTCNSKIVGARYYVDGFGKKNLAKSEYLSPRDGDGHGSHTASTAAGNIVNNVTIDGQNFGTISGMAPGASIAAYKVCWTGKTDDGCATADMVAAIDDATADGVDVINFSIGSSSESPVYDPTEWAFLFAARAGVFVSASAGNSGPGVSTLDHPSPWLTTVAASTHKINEKQLVLGDGQTFVGASTTVTLPDLTPMVMSEASAAAGQTAANARLCTPGSLDPAKVTGKLVVCIRGVIARADKSWAVRMAGGAGMVLINPAPMGVAGDLHYVPSVHLENTALAPVTTYVTTAAAPTGKIVALTAPSSTEAPAVAEFSSRGPSTTTGGDILKPDIAAPGVDVLAAVTPYNHHDRNYDLLSGTSMAAPHLAGIAAALRAAHPDWSPMAVKSAIMTTGRDMAMGTTSPFAQGAGNVQPAKAIDPLLVADSGIVDWVGYLKGAGVLDPASSPTIPAITGTQLNQASIASGSVVGSLEVKRTFTNVSGAAQTFAFSAAVPGFDVTASPATLTVAAGAKATVTLTFTRTDAALRQYATGSVTWSNASGQVRLPVALRPVVASAPAEIAATGDAGNTTVTVVPGFTGTMQAAAHGLAGTTPVADSVTAGAFDAAAPADSGTGVDVVDVVIPAGTRLARMSTDGADGDDLDLWVYSVKPDGSTGSLVAYSASGSADETVTLSMPAAGTYRAFVHGYSVPSGGAYTWRSWIVGDPTLSNFSVTPASAAVTMKTPVDFTVAWNGLDAAQDYLGVVDFTDTATGQKASTVVEVR